MTGSYLLPASPLAEGREKGNTRRSNAYRKKITSIFDRIWIIPKIISL